MQLKKKRRGQESSQHKGILTSADPHSSGPSIPTRQKQPRSVSETVVDIQGALCVWLVATDDSRPQLTRVRFDAKLQQDAPANHADRCSRNRLSLAGYLVTSHSHAVGTQVARPHLHRLNIFILLIFRHPSHLLQAICIQEIKEPSKCILSDTAMQCQGVCRFGIVATICFPRKGGGEREWREWRRGWRLHSSH